MSINTECSVANSDEFESKGQIPVAVRTTETALEFEYADGTRAPVPDEWWGGELEGARIFAEALSRWGLLQPDESIDDAAEAITTLVVEGAGDRIYPCQLPDTLLD